MKNEGSCPWPENTALVYIAGNRLAAFNNAPTRYKVGLVEPGHAVDVWAGDMKVSNSLNGSGNSQFKVTFTFRPLMSLEDM
jgi:next-to-BRCA1 protein 1